MMVVCEFFNVQKMEEKQELVSCKSIQRKITSSISSIDY